jgi:hypothetical protein
MSDGSAASGGLEAFRRVLADPSLTFRHPRRGDLYDHARILRLIWGPL